MNVQERIVLAELIGPTFTLAVEALEREMGRRIGEATPHEMREALAGLGLRGSSGRAWQAELDRARAERDGLFAREEMRRRGEA